MDFKPCQSKTHCRDDGKRCLTCGRSLEEIRWLRDLMDQLASLAVDYEYENVEAFAQYVARKIPKMVDHRFERDKAIPGSTGEAAHAD